MSRSGHMSTPAKLRQHVRYVNASDGTRLAWAESGAGPLVVKAANWLTHLEYEWESPVWKHWMQFFSAHFRFVRYDERGCGLSDGQAVHCHLISGSRISARSSMPLDPTGR